LFRCRTNETVRPDHAGGTAHLKLPDESSFTRAWNTERAAVIHQLALERVRTSGPFTDRALDAFEQYGLRGRPATTVAALHDMSVDDVYAAKYRVGKALKVIIRTIEAAYDDSPPARVNGQTIVPVDQRPGAHPAQRSGG